MIPLNENDTGDLVEKWQTFLCGQGLLESVSCVYDADTVVATKAYQKANRLAPNGTFDNATMMVAMQSGLPTDTSGYPAKPPFLEPYSNTESDDLFGVIKWKWAPQPNNKENIIITNKWSADNIVKVDIPQLNKFISNGSIFWHKNGVDNVVKLFQDWDDAGLMQFVLTWGGSWVPRLVRGSTTSLSNHCLPASEFVYTTNGPISIADLNDFSGEVWCYDNGKAVTRKITKFFNNGMKDILKIKTSGNIIRCTENHPVLVMRKKTLTSDKYIKHLSGRGQKRALYFTEMVKASDLKIGDMVVTCKNLPEVEKINDINGDWAEILGLFLGDGCINHKNEKAEFVSFFFPEGDRVRSYVYNLLYRHFGEYPKKNKYALFLYKQEFTNKFLPYDKKAHFKEMPTDVWSWSNENKKRLLLGLLYSDGTVGRSKSNNCNSYGARYTFKMVSRKIIYQIRMLMTCLGFRVSSVTTCAPHECVLKKTGQIIRGGVAYSVSGHDVLGVISHLDDPVYDTRIKSQTSMQKCSSPCYGYETLSPHFKHSVVQKIEKDGCENVYDIEVEGLHNFISGGIVVSNSRGTAFDINVKWNYLGQNPAKRGQQGSVVDLVNIATNNNFFWGYWFGQQPYGTRVDGMHFQLAKRLD